MKNSKISNKREGWKKDARSMKGRFRRSKVEAKRRKIDWTITFNEFCALNELPCFYCKNLIGTKVETSAGLDRVDNSLPYTVENVVPCCVICNRIRNIYLTPEETQNAMADLIEFRRSKGLIK